MNKIKFAFLSIIVLLFLTFVYFITYTFVEPKAYDFMTKHVLTERLPFDTHKQTYGSDDVVVVVIDTKSSERYRWPWKRELLCKIFNYFNDYTEAKSIIYDANISSLDKDNPESDKKFFYNINKIDNFVLGFIPQAMPWENQEQGAIYDKAFEKKFALNAVNNKKLHQNLYQSILPYPTPCFYVIKNAGSVTAFPGFINGLSNWNIFAMDEVFRTYEYVFEYKGQLYPSLALKTFLMAYDNPQMIVDDKTLTFPDLDYKIKMKATPYQSIVPIKYYKLFNGYSHQKFSAIDIMDSYDNIKDGKKAIINPQIFKDKIVVIGANVTAGAGLNDNKNTPMVVAHPGVDIQASAIDNILHNDFLKVTPHFVNLFIVILGMLMVYGIIRVYDLFKSISLTFTLLIGYLAFSAICFYFGVVINVITPVVMFVVMMIIAYIHKFIIENQSKEKVKSAMGKYMSQDVMKRIVMNIDNLGLGGKKATVTVLFSDIRGFTSLSETMSAEQVSEILNEYFTEMEPIVAKHNGIINKFIGDAVMAIFGEPIQDKNHALNAVRCGYKMLVKVKELQRKWASEGKPKIDIGVGINTGEVFVGNIGSINRMEYTVIGDTVNLASRLESYNKIYKTSMLIGSTTYEATKNYIEVIKISDVEIRGKAHKMDIYEVLKVD